MKTLSSLFYFIVVVYGLSVIATESQMAFNIFISIFVAFVGVAIMNENKVKK